MVRLKFDDLPRYSPWPQRLLGLTPWEVHYKNPSEIKREYDNDKWGAVYSRLKVEGLTLSELEAEGAKAKMLGYTDEDGFILAESNWWQKRKLDMYENVIRHINESGKSCLELGSGYGSVIIPLAERLKDQFVNFGAGEYTDSGLSAMRLLVERQNKNIRTGYCDFFTLSCENKLASLPTPIIFTSFALMYIPELKSDFVDWLIDMKPEAVVHFEPIYEYYDIQTLWGCLCKRYIEVNDYNRNLWKLLSEAEQRGKIKILLNNKNVYGSNAMLPISVIGWKSIG